MSKFRVLHICNTAGVASVLAKYMDKYCGTESMVYTRKALDPYGLTMYGEVLDCGAWRFAWKMLWKARKFSLVHVHDFDKLLPWLRMAYKHKPLVMHYHGSRIRFKWRERRTFWQFADAVLYSTKDLAEGAPSDAMYFPNPVDTELFRPVPECLKQPCSALSMDKDLDRVLAEKYAEKYGLKLTVQALGVPHCEMPRLLSRFEYYIDTKRIEGGHGLSKTALEALACGVKVIDWKGEVVERLPPMHHPKASVELLHVLYKGLVAGKLTTLWRKKTERG